MNRLATLSGIMVLSSFTGAIAHEGWRTPMAYATNQTVACASVGADVCSQPFWASMAVYHKRLAPSVRSGAVLLLGDSHVQGVAASSVGISYLTYHADERYGEIGGAA